MFKGFDKTTLPGSEIVPDYFERDLTDEEESFMRKQFRHYIFVTDRANANHGVCSNCGQEIGFRSKTIHNDEKLCPRCKIKLPVIHTWRGIKKCRQVKMFYLYEKVKDEKAIGCRVVIAYLWPFKEDTEARSSARITYTEDSRTLFLYGAGAIQMEWMDSERGWEETADITERRGKHLTISTRNVYIPKKAIAKAVQGTPFAWSNWTEFLKSTREYTCPLIKYFNFFAKYEASEYLAKIGLFGVIRAYIYCDSNPGRCIHWHGKTPNEIFGIKTIKADRKYLHEHAKKISIYDISFWIEANRREQTYLREAQILAKNWNTYPRTAIKNTSISLKKLARYLALQQEKGIHVTVWDYEDYIRECKELELDLKEKSTLFPKNLLQAHGNLSAQIKYKENLALENAWQKRRPSLEVKYQFHHDGKEIVIPEKITDLIAEGKMQHNCVGGYMERVAKGQTDVVFVRRKSNPETSYITVEIRGGMILQARTKNNERLDAEGTLFMEEFRRKVLEKKKRARVLI